MTQQFFFFIDKQITFFCIHLSVPALWLLKTTYPRTKVDLRSIAETASVTTADMNGDVRNPTERSSVLARMGTFGSATGSYGYGTFGDYSHYAHSSGLRLFRQRLYAMFVKRVLHSKRHKASILSQLLLPLFFTLIALISAKMYPQPTDSPALNLSTHNYLTNYVPWKANE